MAIYTPTIGKEVLRIIHLNGYPKAELIGSLGRGYESNHDIDILIPLTRQIDKSKCAIKIMNIFKPKHCCGQDWGGAYYTDTIFGDIDLFFNKKNFTF